MAKEKTFAEIARLLGKTHVASMMRKRPDWAQSMTKRVQEELVPALEQYDLRLAELEGDDLLTHKAKDLAKNKYKKELHPRLEALKKETSDKIRGQIIAKESELKHKVMFKPSADAAERAAQEARAAEFRSQVRGLDPLERTNLYLSLAAQGELFEVWALESGPLAVAKHPKSHPSMPGYSYASPLISEDDRTALAVRRIGAEFPEEVQAMEELRQLADSWDQILAAVATAVGPVDPNLEPKPAPPAPKLTGDPSVDVFIKNGLTPPAAPATIDPPAQA
jgi:hypothetical protein